MRVNKKPSLNKINEKKLSATAREMFWPGQNKTPIQQKPQTAKAPIFRRNLRNVSSKQIETKPRLQTQTTLSESTMMFQSMYGGKDWLKPSDYLKQIGELNLLGNESNMEVKQYDINLNDKYDKNLQKYSRLKEVTQKWVTVLKKAIGYTKSTKAASDKLIEEVKFWKVLSRKFDQLEYEFKQQKTVALLNIMRNVLKTEPSYRQVLEEFICLKQEIIVLTPSIKRLHLQLESVVSGFILKLEQCSDICQSINLLKIVLIGFTSIYQENPLLRGRLVVIYEKVDQCMTQKLIATSLYPRQLANISSVKEYYHILDSTLSFYSNFLTALENSPNMQDLIEKVEYSRQILSNLLQILTYFEYLYKHREVNEFSKLFSYPLNFNIYEQQYSQQWGEYMEMVNASMQRHKFEP